MPPPQTYKSEIGSQSTMCLVQAGAYVLTTRAWRSQIFRLPSKEDYHVHITRSIYHYAYARQA